MKPLPPIPNPEEWLKNFMSEYADPSMDNMDGVNLGKPYSYLWTSHEELAKWVLDITPALTPANIIYIDDKAVSWHYKFKCEDLNAVVEWLRVLPLGG